MRLFSALCLLILTLEGCVSIPKDTQVSTRRIEVGPGPEDLDLDDYGYQPRLLISCSDRINRDDPQFGEIVAYYPDNGGLDTLPRKGEPNGLRFFPHGIDFAVVNGKPCLYVISHDDLNHRHWVIQYEVFRDHLMWVRDYESPLFTSPNDLAVEPNGNFWVSNDRKNPDKITEMLLGTKKATLVHCDTAGNASIYADGYAMGNGVMLDQRELYWATTRGNTVYRFDPTQNEAPQEWKTVRGGDNLTKFQDKVLVGAHLSNWALFKHSKNIKKPSPTVIYQLSEGKDDPEVLFADHSGRINAGTMGLVFRNKLYIGQVFDNWILEVDLWEGK